MSFLWYDLETFGKDHLRSRIAQFAAQRTDGDLNPIGEPLVLHCRPADDLLPSPEATLVTGITPQDALRDGLREAEFVNKMMAEFSVPHTCAVGFNSLRFDDEFVRVSAYRNFHDPYAREWKDRNSRWDLLDVLRLAHALRPDGIVWPRRRDGTTSFKLTDLTAANGIGHEHAHDALADVQATLGMARLLKRAHPRLFDYALTLSDKRNVARLLDTEGMSPILHISSKFPAARRHAALVAPICQRPEVPNQVIAFDLSADPQPLLDLDADDIADRLYTPAADLPEGVARIPLKAIHLNKCPMLVELKTLRDPDIERLQLDRAMAQRRAQQLRDAPGLIEKVQKVFARPGDRQPADADAALFDRFIPNGDLALFTRIRNAAPADLPAFANKLKDSRLHELLFRYQARNWPESLDVAQRERWDAHRRQRLECDVGLSEYSFETYAAAIARLRVERAGDGRAQALLDQLDAWGRELRTSLS
ncbi:MAG: exodeoxyribonuclease I [Proteobacteria bacterium]|nr:exodeoxyribonuclease I [Pseudomonadota bacterium]MBS0461904.1 exodeoxyribonuclease I [Pseudomonadota bacterium]MBS0463661.1 exodeoxyribonuclease I [Pseudomonadota bacterium]